MTTILGVRFLTGDARTVVRDGLQGGLVVVPSAPVLVGMRDDPALREALLGADKAVTDSGLMVLLWRLTGGGRITRVSGLEYLKLLLDQPDLRETGRVLWVMPSVDSRDRNLTWLKANGHTTSAEACYVAPLYPPGALTDTELLGLARRMRPSQIILCLGGGTQERLGYYLRRSLEHRPGIHCIGAAIAFLSGEQVRIPAWADRFYLGWLFRSFSNPRRFVPRYYKALRLIPLFLRYRDRPPV
jgi:N-acetylglucosaminyldiphosphoundecaprenol N-acetyl-beta-D-mannosaminyltransferase